MTTPRYEVQPYTLVIEQTTKRHLMRMEALLPLPKGSRLEVTSPEDPSETYDAIVTEIRVLPGLSEGRAPMLLCLEVIRVNQGQTLGQGDERDA